MSRLQRILRKQSKSISGDASVKESMTDEAIKGMVNSMLGE